MRMGSRVLARAGTADITVNAAAVCRKLRRFIMDGLDIRILPTAQATRIHRDDLGMDVSVLKGPGFVARDLRQRLQKTGAKILYMSNPDLLGRTASARASTRSYRLPGRQRLSP